MKKEIYSENTRSLLFTMFESAKQRKTDMYRIHKHAELELGFIIEGEGHYILDGEAYNAKAGDLFLIRPNEQHCVPTIYTPELVSFNFHVTSYYLWNICSEYLTPGSLPMLLGHSPIKHRFSGKDGYIEKIRYLANDGRENLGKIRFLTLSLLESIAAELELPILPSTEKSDKPPAHLDDIQNVIRYINEHLTEPLTLELLAKVSNISRSHFSSVFKRVTGVTPYEYLILQRVERAVGYLKHSRLHISEIASLCGFNSFANFNRIFKKITGMSPSIYRSSVQSDNTEK